MDGPLHETKPPHTPSQWFANVGLGFSDVPGKRDKGSGRLDAALEALTAALEATAVPWMVIGGIAVISHGVRRMTTDIDAVVRGDAISLEALLRAFAKFDIKPRIQGAKAFAQENLVLLLRHQRTGVDLDISLAWTAFEHEALAARIRPRHGSITFPMARVDDLVVYKTLAARPKDIDDAAALLLLHAEVDVRRIRQRLTELAAMAEQPELAEGFERVLAHVKSVRRAVTARSAPKKRTSRKPAVPKGSGRTTSKKPSKKKAH